MAEEIRLNISAGAAAERTAKSAFDEARQRSDSLYGKYREVSESVISPRLSDSRRILRQHISDVLVGESHLEQFKSRSSMTPDQQNAWSVTHHERLLAHAGRLGGGLQPVSVPRPTPQPEVEFTSPVQSVQQQPPPPTPPTSPPTPPAPPPRPPARRIISPSPLVNTPPPAPPAPPPQSPPASPPPAQPPAPPTVPPAPQPPGGTPGGPPPNRTPQAANTAFNIMRDTVPGSPFPEWWNSPFQRGLWNRGGPQLQRLTGFLGVSPWQAVAGLAGVSTLGAAIGAGVLATPSRALRAGVGLATAPVSASGVAAAPLNAASKTIGSLPVQGVGMGLGAAAGFGVGGPLGAVLGGAISGGIIGGISDTLGEFAETIKLADDALKSMTDDIAPFSAQASYAVAMADLMQLDARMRRAQALGPELGDITMRRAEIESILMDIQNDFLEPMLPVIEGIAIEIRDFIRFYKPIFTAENGSAAIGVLMDTLGKTLIGPAAPIIKKWAKDVIHHLSELGKKEGLPDGADAAINEFLSGREFSGVPRVNPSLPRFRPLMGP